MPSDIVLQAIIAGIVTIVLAWMSHRTKTSVEKVGAAAEMTAVVVASKVEQVAAELGGVRVVQGVKLDEIKHVADKTHTLVDGSMTVQLRFNAIMARELANIKKTEESEKVAAAAETALASHEEQQRKIEAKDEKAIVLAQAVKDVAKDLIPDVPITTPYKE